MERIVIIDHETHSLFIEDVNEEVLQNEYGGEEENWIRDNYVLSDNWSWEYITSGEYFPGTDVNIPIDIYELLEDAVI